MSFSGVETLLSPAKRRDGSGSLIPGVFTKRRVIVCLCDQCGTRILKKFKRGDLSKYQEGLSYCDQMCADLATKTGGATRLKMEATCFDRYGNNNPAKLAETWVKIEATCYERYGAPSYLGSRECAEATAKFLSDRNATSFLGVPEIRDRFHTTLHTNYGVRWPTQSPIVRARQRATSTKNCGHPYFLQSPEGRRRLSALGRDPAYQAKRHAALLKNGVFKRTSSRGEDAVFKVLVDRFPETQRHVHIHRWDIDFFVPELNRFINYNGTYWHGRNASNEDLRASPTLQSKTILATKHRDLQRSEWFHAQGLLFSVLWEDTWQDDLSTILGGLYARV